MILIVLATASSYAQIADSTLRKIKIQGVINFRDMGYNTKDGHLVKREIVYRSADLSKLKDPDLKELKARKIVCDVAYAETKRLNQLPTE